MNMKKLADFGPPINKYGISDVHFNAIKRGAARRMANPFAGLFA